MVTLAYVAVNVIGIRALMSAAGAQALAAGVPGQLPACNSISPSVTSEDRKKTHFCLFVTPNHKGLQATSSFKALPRCDTWESSEKSNNGIEVTPSSILR